MMFTYDETARNNIQSILFSKIFIGNLDKMDSLSFGDCLEIQVEANDISEATLSLIYYYLLGRSDGHIVHASCGDNLHYSLSQSKLDITGTDLQRADTEARLKAGVILNASELCDLFDDLAVRQPYFPTLLLLETLSPILYAEKVSELLVAYKHTPSLTLRTIVYD